MKTILSNSKVNALLEFASQKMLDSPRHAIEFDTDWPLFAPADPGIYCIFHGDKLLYAGETGNIRKRMKDLRRTMNHSFRRSLGKQLFSGHAGFVAAHNKAKFPVKFEQELNNYMATKLGIVVMPVFLGRKELEEHIVGNQKPQFNARSKRA